MNLDYTKLVEAAILAPTPDNNQPWRFAVREGKLLVFLDAARTLPSDVNAMFDLVGLGAAVENACIAARSAGFEPKVDLADCPAEALRDPSRPAASISFVSGGQPDRLYPYLEARCTCRKLYSTQPPPAEALQEMSKAVEAFSAVRLDWITDRPKIKELASLVAACDLIRLQYEPFHNELFRQLRFTADEVERTRDGLDIRTLDLPPGAAWLLKKLRPWKRMHLINRLGLGRLLVVPSSLAVKRSGAIGLLYIDHSGTDLFLAGGRALERAWLVASNFGLALQPLGSVPIFLAHLQQLAGAKLCTAHATRLTAIATRLESLSNHDANRAVLQIAFRLGRAAPPKCKSTRRKVGDVFHA